MAGSQEFKKWEGMWGSGSTSVEDFEWREGLVHSEELRYGSRGHHGIQDKGRLSLWQGLLMFIRTPLGMGNMVRSGTLGPCFMTLVSS